jgi:hypothetical protein
MFHETHARLKCSFLAYVGVSVSRCGINASSNLNHCLTNLLFKLSVRTTAGTVYIHS